MVNVKLYRQYNCNVNKEYVAYATMCGLCTAPHRLATASQSALT